MNLTIYKYPINPKITELQMPRGAKLLCIQVQNGLPQLWALVDADEPREKRTFVTYGTGHRIIPEAKDDAYIGTWQTEGGALVWHAFEASK